MFDLLIKYLVKCVKTGDFNIRYFLEDYIFFKISKFNTGRITLEEGLEIVINSGDVTIFKLSKQEETNEVFKMHPAVFKTIQGNVVDFNLGDWILDL